MKTNFICSQCSNQIEHLNEYTTGYAIIQNNEKICYSCCAENDSNALIKLSGKEKIIMYFDDKIIMNWPGTLHIIPTLIKTGKHNFCKTRTDVYFKHRGKTFHGVHMGSNNTIIHINALQ